MAKVEVDEVFCLVCDVRAKVPANYTVPCRVVLLIKLFLYVSCNVLFYVELLHGLCCAVDSFLLHVFAHVGIFNDSFSLSHFLIDLREGVCKFNIMYVCYKNVCITYRTRGIDVEVVADLRWYLNVAVSANIGAL